MGARQLDRRGRRQQLDRGGQAHHVRAVVHDAQRAGPDRPLQSLPWLVVLRQALGVDQHRQVLAHVHGHAQARFRVLRRDAFEDHAPQALRLQRLLGLQQKTHQLRLTRLDPGDRRRHDQQGLIVPGNARQRREHERRLGIRVLDVDTGLAIALVDDDDRGLRQHARGMQRQRGKARDPCGRGGQCENKSGGNEVHGSLSCGRTSASAVSKGAPSRRIKNGEGPTGRSPAVAPRRSRTVWTRCRPVLNAAAGSRTGCPGKGCARRPARHHPVSGGRTARYSRVAYR
ncbi:hypothetical protein D9M68_685040 [compost metagenome]